MNLSPREVAFPGGFCFINGVWFFLMSKILALDTSTDVCSVALNYDGEIEENFVDIPRDHTRRVLPMVDEMLSQHQIGLRDLDAIAFGRGPGSFTGLRICLSMVQGLAFAADLPLIPVSTLKTTALSAIRLLKLTQTNPIMAALDARMGQIYWGLFAKEGKNVVELGNEYVNSPGEMFKHPELSAIKNPVVGVGQGWSYQSLQSLMPVATFPECRAHALDLAYIAAESFTAGEGISALDAEPVYIRDEITWQKRQRQRQP